MLLFFYPMDQDVTLASIKDMLQKYSSKKSLFTDSAILNKIDESRTRIQEKVESKSPGLVSLLKECSEEIRQMKMSNKRIEASECVECLVILNRIKKEIEGVRKDNTKLKNRLWVCKVLLIPVVSILAVVYLNKYFN